RSAFEWKRLQSLAVSATLEGHTGGERNGRIMLLTFRHFACFCRRKTGRTTLLPRKFRYGATRIISRGSCDVCLLGVPFAGSERTASRFFKPCSEAPVSYMASPSPFAAHSGPFADREYAMRNWQI